MLDDSATKPRRKVSAAGRNAGKAELPELQTQADKPSTSVQSISSNCSSGFVTELVGSCSLSPLQPPHNSEGYCHQGSTSFRFPRMATMAAYHDSILVLQTFVAEMTAPAVGNEESRRDYCLVDAAALERLNIPPGSSIGDRWLSDHFLNAYTWCVPQIALLIMLIDAVGKAW